MNIMKKLVRAGAAVLCLTMGSTAIADTTQLRLTSYLPPSHYANTLIIKPLIEEIKEATEGSVIVKNFPGGQLANGAGTFNAIKSGIANMGIVGIGFVGESMPLSTIIEVPGAFNQLAAGHSAYTGLIKEELLELEYLPNKVRPLFSVILPQQQLLLAKNIEINSLSDLSGLKIRVPHATAGEAIAALGMVPVEMPITDLYLGLERGTVDGATTFTASVSSYNLEEVTQSITSNLAMGAVAFTLFINERDWNKLSPEQQEQISRVSEEAGVTSVATMDRLNSGAEEKLISKGMKIIKVSDAVQQEINSALTSVQEDWITRVSERNPKAAEVAEKYNSLLESVK